MSTPQHKFVVAPLGDKKVWLYYQPFRYNTLVWRTDRQTDR